MKEWYIFINFLMDVPEGQAENYMMGKFIGPKILLYITYYKQIYRDDFNASL